eukprot:1428156-Prymnesium_polylepis.1
MPPVILSVEATRQHQITGILMQQSSIAGIKCEISKDMWKDYPDYPSLPDMVPGTLVKWINKADFRVSADWIDGRDSECLRQLLLPEFNFRLVANANGGPPPRLRGQAAADAAVAAAVAAPPRATVDIKYTSPETGLDATQVWEHVEMHASDARAEPRYGATLRSVDPNHTKEPFGMARRVGFPSTILGKWVKFMNERLSVDTTAKDTINRYTTEGE